MTDFGTILIEIYLTLIIDADWWVLINHYKSKSLIRLIILKLIYFKAKPPISNFWLLIKI